MWSSRYLATWSNVKHAAKLLLLEILPRLHWEQKSSRFELSMKLNCTPLGSSDQDKILHFVILKIGSISKFPKVKVTHKIIWNLEFCLPSPLEGNGWRQKGGSWFAWGWMRSRWRKRKRGQKEDDYGTEHCDPNGVHARLNWTDKNSNCPMSIYLVNTKWAEETRKVKIS